MNLSRNWLGWLSISLGAIALLIALSGWGFGTLFTSGFDSRTISQAYARQGGQSQNSLPESGRFIPNSSGVPAGERQHAGVGRRGGQPADGGFSFDRWLSFPFKLLDGLRNGAMLVILVALGVLLLRGRGFRGNRPTEVVQQPAQEQRSPTGESYVNEPSDSVE